MTTSIDKKIAVLVWAENAIKFKDGIEFIVAKVNQVWGEDEPLPVGQYRRYAHLLADVVRMLAQLKAERIDMDLKLGRPVDEEGNDTREWSGESIEAAHAEALAIEAADVRSAEFWGNNDSCQRRRIVTQAHTEALIDDAIFEAGKRLGNDPLWMDSVDVSALHTRVSNLMIRKVSKATEQFAERRNMAVRQIDDLVMLIKDGRVLFTLIAGIKGFSFGKNRHLPPQVKEELPGYYADETHLRNMIDYLSKELKTP